MSNVAERIKRALFDKGWTVKKLCGAIEVSEAGYKHMVENNSWKLHNLSKIAEVLGMPLTALVAEEEPEEIGAQSADKGSFGSEVAERILEEFRELKAQLSIKDRQIDGMQRTIDALLGTSGAVKREKSFRKPALETGRILELYPAEQSEAKKVA